MNLLGLSLFILVVAAVEVMLMYSSFYLFEKVRGEQKEQVESKEEE